MTWLILYSSYIGRYIVIGIVLSEDSQGFVEDGEEVGGASGSALEYIEIYCV